MKILGFFGVVLLSIFLAFFYFYSQVKVDIDKIINYNPKLSTQIYDRNGDLVANIFDEQNRLYVKYNEIPPRIIEALVAIEDTSFFEHGGINYEAIFRAAIKNVKSLKLAEGASTLTQQLIKNMVLTNEKKFERKLKEAVIAYKLEASLTKEQIIERYLNEVYFGHGYYGIKTAARGYFKKDLRDLSLKEIAILVGIPKAPSTYDPTKHLDLSISRANSVLFRLNTLGWITNSEYEQALNQKPVIFNETLTQNKAPYLVDEVIKEASKIYPDIKSNGYKIQINADLRVQNLAKDALKFGYGEILKRDNKANTDTLNGAIIVINPQNGEILALVGGVDYTKSSFNRATQSIRQPGSSFKPFVYQVALDIGYSPLSKVADIARVFEAQKKQDTWKPKNYGGDFKGYISLKEAITLSRNLATINLLTSIGLDVMQEKLIKMGFENIPQNLSIALGSFGVSLIDFSKFYSIFPGGGTMSKPYLIKSISDKDGLELVKFEPEKKEILKPEQAYLMVDMLKNVVENGTGKNAKTPGIEVAGKTGTTNDSVDAWFCGFSQDVQVIIWYGNDNNTPMKKVEGGSRTAAPVFGNFMKNYIKLNPSTRRNFKAPKGVMRKVYNGKDEIYTEISPLPKQNINDIANQEDEGIIF